MTGLSPLSDLLMHLWFGGLTLWASLVFILWWLTSWRRLSRSSRVALPVKAFCLLLTSSLPFVIDLGTLVGGTTKSDRAGLAADGKYYLYAWWRTDPRTPVSPETYRTLYWCEHGMMDWSFTVAILAGLAFFRVILRQEREEGPGFGRVAGDAGTASGAQRQRTPNID